MNLNNLFYELLIEFQIPDFYAKLINLFLVGLIIVLVVVILNYISKTFIRNFIERISINSKNNFDNFFEKNCDVEDEVEVTLNNNNVMKKKFTETLDVSPWI